MAKRLSGEHLSAWFGRHQVLHDVSLVAEPGAVTTLIGPAGAGKTTLLRSLNRMHEITPGARRSGRVLLGDQDVYGRRVDPASVRRAMGMIFGRPNLFPSMSVRDNVAAGLRLNGRLPKRSVDDAVEWSLRETGLWEQLQARLDEPATHLPRGLQQLLCVARALAVGPEALLLDEPCAALDPLSTLLVEELLAALKDTYTIVLVTHDLGQAARVSDVTAFLSAPEPGAPGRLVEVGPTATVFTTPADARTEAYLTGRHA